MTHRIGIIGLGTVGTRFVEQFGLHDAFDVVAGWDPDPTACAAHADDIAIQSDADGVIAAADAVYVATPPLFHRQYVEACVRADVGIFCEKPLGVDVAESRALVDLVNASGLPAGVNFVFSAAPSATGLLDDVRTGSLGEVVRADLRLHFAEWPRAWHAKAQWLQHRDQGGWIREVASHFLFLVGRALGPLAIESSHVVFADGVDGALSEVSATAHLTTASGLELSLAGTSGGTGPDVVDLTVRGTDGASRVWNWYRLQSSDGSEWIDRGAVDPAVSSAAAYAAQLGELSEMLAGRPHTIATFDEALTVQELVERLLESTS
ncbi:MAG: Gfo/Idh/MocA family protein [Ilumatobacter sp.]